jgi:LysM repeat protein
MDGAPACPFVAYVDDRDGRSSSPDHRHRCFAESPPAPRAVAHQEAYCLSSAFPVCPVFQEWARREAAQARGQGTPADDAAAAGAGVAGTGAPGAGGAGAAAGWDAQPTGGQTAMPPPDPPVQRNPPRDWAAPPPWATAAPGARSSGSTPPDAPPARPVEGQGLAGSTADQLAGGEPPNRSAAVWSASAAGASASVADEDLAGLVSPRPAPTAPPLAAPAPPPAVPQPTTSSGRRPTVSSTRSSGPTINGPAWEQARREEAYPSIRRRAGLPGLPRLAVIAGAIGIAALILFMLPAVFGIGGPSATPKPSATAAAPSVSAAPTAVPAPTPTVYVVKSGDTMSKIAKKFGVSLDDLIAANKDKIKNPDKLAVGDEVIIPLPSSGGGSAAPSGSTTP